VGEADFAGHPLGKVEEEGVGVGLEFGDAVGELVGEVGVVVEEFGAGVDDGFCAKGGDVVGVVFEDLGEALHGETEGDPAALGVRKAVEVDEVGAGDLEEELVVVGPGFALAVKVLAGFVGLAVADQELSCPERACRGGDGGLGQGELVVLLGEKN
jgi:hypothetical protein